MEYVALGRTDLLVSHTALGAESLGQLEESEAAALVRLAYDEGVNFFDTSHSTPKSEAALGRALLGLRGSVLLATKTAALPPQELRLALQESLAALQTDHIDLYQLEQPPYLPRRGAADGVYETLAALKDGGTVRHIGIATDSLELAFAAAESGAYDAVQFPFSVLSSPKVAELSRRCGETGTGFIAMQPLCGGVVSDIRLAFGFLSQFENVVPLWGARNAEELRQILRLAEHPPLVDEQLRAEAERQRAFFS